MNEKCLFASRPYDDSCSVELKTRLNVFCWLTFGEHFEDENVHHPLN